MAAETRSINGNSAGDKVLVTTGLGVGPSVAILTVVNGVIGSVDLSLVNAELLAEAIYEAIKRAEEDDK